MPTCGSPLVSDPHRLLAPHRIVDYALPRHCQDTWTVLIVDAGAISYDLDTRHCGASGRTVAVLPPGVIHDGRPADGSPGFRKRNLYLERTSCPPHWSARPSTAPSPPCTTASPPTPTRWTPRPASR